MTGHFENQATFGGINGPTLTVAGSSDVFVIKLVRTRTPRMQGRRGRTRCPVRAVVLTRSPCRCWRARVQGGDANTGTPCCSLAWVTSGADSSTASVSIGRRLQGASSAPGFYYEDEGHAIAADGAGGALVAGFIVSSGSYGTTALSSAPPHATARDHGGAAREPTGCACIRMGAQAWAMRT